MSAYNFYDASIPLITEALDGLVAILKKGEQAPNAASLPEARIYEDMLPLSFQVHFTTDLAQKLAARSTGTEPLSLEGNLKTFPEFYQRIEQVQQILAKVDKDTVNKRVNESITIGLGPGKTGEMVTRNYLSGYIIPNVFFHVTTAYNIMRKEGVPLGKMDFLSPFITKHVASQ
ncbi:hypothetical protein QQS21_008652 [Conoideocrella luteorostrata]|uniref:DUF1993 domain-containing protein n=1 Tax=Conoideocrella luteorostrata TaxID=1105319 RepID=A0AAJ0CIF6_9HYPO|nr:hypothetical protein QQS21_008652 [Conoideocrella luteorostrata]